MTETEIKNFSDSGESKKSETVLSLKEGELIDCFKKVAGPALLVSIVDILIRIDLSSSGRSFTLFLSWSIRLIFFIYLSYQVVFSYKKDIRQAAVFGGLAGLILGFLAAIYNLFLVKKVWAVFNLVVEPIWFGLLGGLLVAGLSWLFIKFKK